MDNMGAFREEMFRNASVHGGLKSEAMTDRTLTPESLKASEKALEQDKQLQDILKEAEDKKLVEPGDKVLRDLVQYFFRGAANTQEGRMRALRMSIGIVFNLRQKYDITAKKI